MEVRDPVHGSIPVFDEEIPIIQHKFFQRLRAIKQLGFSEYAFPGATHTRFLHSIGVMSVGTKAFDKLFEGKHGNPEVLRLRETLRLSCLLHDIGHAPLSHSTETVMPNLSELKLSSRFLSDKDKAEDRQATHEDYTIKSIADSSFSESFKLVEKKFGVDKNAIADLVVGRTTDEGYFTVNGVNYFPLLHQLVSSEMDCDRMDYLLRDSYFCGVSYGQYDLDWLIDNLSACVIDNKAYIGISERAIATFDDFLLSRFHMFIMVYFHYRAVCLEQVLYRYFQTSNEYKIPADIEKYQEHDDQFLMKVLKNSDNQWAKKIVANEIPRKIFETFGEEQEPKLNEIIKYCESDNIDYILCSSLGRISKYYTTDDSPNVEYPMQMVRNFYGQAAPEFFPIDQATVIFQKFSHAHSVKRMHIDMESLPQEKREKVLKLVSR